jgi:hypothetical protein
MTATSRIRHWAATAITIGRVVAPVVLLGAALAVAVGIRWSR